MGEYTQRFTGRFWANAPKNRFPANSLNSQTVVLEFLVTFQVLGTASAMVFAFNYYPIQSSTMNTRLLLAVTIASLLSAATGFAQTTTTTPTDPRGTPAGSANTGTTNSGGVAPASGRPTTTPTGPAAGGTGSGTTPAARATGRPETPPPSTTTTTTSTTTAGPGNGPGTNRGKPHTVNENASDNAKAVQAVLRQFDVKRDAMAAERKALLDKLATAKTETERTAILDQLRTEQKAHADEQRALGKEIREELKKVREQRKTTSGS